MPLILHCDEYDRWLHGSFEDIVGLHRQTFPPELRAMDRTSELWVKMKAATEPPLLLLQGGREPNDPQDR
jgi:hypothetical protein